ncbi:SDR family NAD(P)-dependent oxidoreductase [Actinomadura barringtoniae]|uniref:SDR family NAD(P)-dependent oxidoreductase n=1 Tax=Actinomadura barringtoniae TaxID=1427535 RepID=A0A939PB96_9ACTN|nr:SDR family NAD(P)-dependent oxidoreductase [Actinomadura barringtoniae]MBO2449607.1 SDR family NAD(P)-dependent oxidoreductase [Actinomadura barringtoniae]
MTDLRGSRILLTGASSGIGRALAIALAGHGARVAVSARREPELRKLPAEHVLPADLSIRGAAATLAERAAHAMGGIDILINNAGVSVIAPQSDLGDDDEARASFETNFWTPLALARAALPAMPGNGTIVNVTSTVQSVPLPLLGYYAASKSALAQATRALRHELRHTDIRVLEIVPGSTDTPLRDIDLLPWRGGKPPRTFPPVPPESVAAATIKALRKNKQRMVHPAYSLAPLELPVIGRLVASIAARRIRTESETLPTP